MTSPSPDLPLLLDTSVVSLFFKANDTRAALYTSDLQGRVLAICYVIVGELQRWAIQRKWGQARIDDMEHRLKLMVNLPSIDTVSRQWARIQTSYSKER